MTSQSINIFTGKKYRCFSLESPDPVKYDGETYVTALHLHQALKFKAHRPDLAKLFLKCRDPVAQAKHYTEDIRPDWFDVSFNMMAVTLYHKFKQHKTPKRKLLETNNAWLVANCADQFWGTGNGQGQNKLGQALMELREALRAKKPAPVPTPLSTIKFFKVTELYYGFTLSSPHPVKHGGTTYQTAQHLFQSFKFNHRPDIVREILKSSNPSKALGIGRMYPRYIQSDWDTKKRKIMKYILYLKFTQHKTLCKQLLQTENALLILASPDAFWGCGQDGKGMNCLGKALMELRRILSGPSRTVVPATRTIEFYEKTDPYYCFTNFSAHHVMYHGTKYPTSEHLFQSFKYPGSKGRDIVKEILSKPIPSHAFSTARKYTPRNGWHRIKDGIMKYIIYLKFTQHANLRAELDGTGDAQLIEASPHDPYWGWGKNKKGENKLGKTLMDVRSILRKNLPAPPEPAPEDRPAPEPISSESGCCVVM